jgi:hypothetical protein
MQREIAASVRDNRRTAVQACHGPGKSFLADRIACWWLDTHEPGTAFVSSTAPTASQVRTVLWREINQAHKKGNLIGRVNQTEWLIGNQLIGFGRKPANPAEGSEDETVTAFQGIHEEYVLVIIDEACGVPEPLWIAADSLITGVDCRILAIGNPDDPTSTSPRCTPRTATGRPEDQRVRHAERHGRDVPAALKKIPPRPPGCRRPRRSTASARLCTRRRSLGISQGRVGRCPPVQLRGCVQAPRLHVEPRRHGHPRRRRGRRRGRDGHHVHAVQEVHPALPKRDPKENPTDGNQWRSRKDDPTACVAEIMDAIGAVRVVPGPGMVTRPVRVYIDSIGVGWAVVGSVQEKCQARGLLEAEVNAVAVSEASEEPETYMNLRAELWWKARDAFREREHDLSELDDVTINELTFPK